MAWPGSSGIGDGERRVRPPFSSEIFERAQEYIDRRRLMIGLCAAVAVALIAALVGVLTSGGGGRSVRTAAFAKVGPTTTVDPAAGAGVGVVNPLDTAPAPGAAPGAVPGSPTTTTPALVLGTTFTRPTTTAAPKAAPKPATPAPTAPPPKGSPPTSTCRNSSDPACGPFSWDPPPAPDQPRQVTLTVSPASPRVGQAVTVHADVHDPDDPQTMQCPSPTYDYGDGPAMSTHCDPAPGSNPCPTRYGPWTPPAAAPGAGQEDQTHSYSTPGVYTITFKYAPGIADGCYNPYASEGSGSITITVSP